MGGLIGVVHLGAEHIMAKEADRYHPGKSILGCPGMIIIFIFFQLFDPVP